MKRIVLLVGLSACWSGRASEPQATKPMVKPAANLVLAPAKLTGVDNGNPLEIALTADGVATLNGELLMSLTSVGEVRNAKGTLIANVGGGKMSFAGKPNDAVLIEENGSTLLSPNTPPAFQFDAAGTLIDEQSDPGSKLTYVGPPEGRRAMMVVYLSMISAVWFRKEPLIRFPGN